MDNYSDSKEFKTPPQFLDLPQGTLSNDEIELIFLSSPSRADFIASYREAVIIAVLVTINEKRDVTIKGLDWLLRVKLKPFKYSLSNSIGQKQFRVIISQLLCTNLHIIKHEV